MRSTAPIQLGPFRLCEEIGRGGMGSVFRGEQSATGVQVAIKIIRPAFAHDERFRAAFRDEVRAVAALDHPGVVMVFDQGQLDAAAEASSGGALVAGAPFLVMELLSHGTLHDAVRRSSDGSPAVAPSWAWLRGVLLDLLDALAHAHARGVVHRDIKPGNMLLTGPGARSAIKLTDFGIAHRLDEGSVGARHGFTGTPHYTAPEQVEGRLSELGPWTDLYAVGCLAYRLAVGRPPFSATESSATDALRRHVTAPVPPLQSRIPVPEGFGAWLDGMLAKAPEQRFRFAADAAAALPELDDVAAGDERSVAPPPVLADEEPTRSGAPFTLPVERTVEWSAGAASMSAAPAPPVASAPSRLPAFPATWRAPVPPPRSHALAGAGLGLFALRAAPFVGRERERDALWAALAAVRAERAPRLVVLRGAAGVGKTRLADWLATRAREVGAANVLAALHAAVPGGADGLGAMLARFLRTAGLTRAAAAPLTASAVLGRGGSGFDALAILELTHPIPDGVRDPGPRVRFASARERHAAVRRYLELLTRERPVLVRIEDAQWGPDALAFAEQLRASAIPALCVLGVSDEALASHPSAAAAVAELCARPGVETITIATLDAERHAELVAGLLGLERALADDVARRTSGNPLFAVQLVGDWVQRGLLDVGASGFVLRAGVRADVPDDIHALWLSRVARAVEASGRGAAALAIERAAALGRVFDAAEWERACAGLAVPSELLPWLELHGLVRREGTAWAFYHGMLVESLARHAREHGRWEAHHRAAAAALREGPLGDAPAVAERVAGHLEAAGDLEAALEPAFVASWQRFESSEYIAALALLDRRDGWAVRLGLAEEDPRRAWGFLRRALVLMRMARPHEAHAWLDRVEATARAHGLADLLAEALYGRAKNAQMSGDVSASIVLYEAATARFQAVGDRRGVARCDNGLGDVLRQLGRFAESRARFRAALDGYAATADRVSRATCLLGLAQLEVLVDRAAGLALAAEAEPELEAVGNRLGLAVVWLVRAVAARGEGRLDDAEPFFWKSAAMLEAVASEDVTVPMHHIGMLNVLRGSFGRAAAIFEANMQRYATTGREAYTGFVCVDLLPCCAAAGDWARFDEHCGAAERLLARTEIVDADLELAARLAAELARRAGQVGRAERAEAIVQAQRAALIAGAVRPA